MFIAVGVVLVLMFLTLAFFRGASTVSGNHRDPFRDVGNGGCTIEGSFRQYALENPDVNLDELAREYGVQLTPGYDRPQMTLTMQAIRNLDAQLQERRLAAQAE